MKTITKQEALEAFNVLAEGFDDIESSTVDMKGEMHREGFEYHRWQLVAEALDTMSEYLYREE